MTFAWKVFISAVAGVFCVCASIAAQETQQAPQEVPKVEEVVVVTASRTEQRVHEAPAAVTVLTADDIEEMPADDYGDILRNVPGLNVSQISARDIQVTGRAATGSLATSQLVLLDGRTLYLDFFGFVMWDFLPVNVSEIKQIEVVHGPGSAVWGANAMTGVINVITKRPAEMTGTSVTLGAGELGTILGSVVHAGSANRWAYKASASYYQQDAYDRPTGLIPGRSTPYPVFENEGTKQPKADLRLDYNRSDNEYFSFGGGYAGTDGLVHTGIGPFDIESGASLSYVKADWFRGAMRATAFANFLDADSEAVLAIGVNGRPISFSFATDTYNVDVSNTSIVGERHILTYGANARKNEFDLELAPLGDERNEIGAFIQDEILFGDNARWVVGARWDDIDPIGSVVSPRTSFLYSPRPNHTVRLSYSRAYRAPSLINNYLDTAIITPITLPTGPFFVPSAAVGNPDLNEERMDAYEVGYVGTLRNNLTLTVNVYRNREQDSADFYTAAFYSPSNPPPRWPLPPQALAVPPLNALPSRFSYRNVGEIVNQGVELGLNGRYSPQWSWFFNYTYQEDPEVSGIDVTEVTQLPPNHRANAGAGYDPGNWFINANVNYQDEAFWTDVLDFRFWGPTESFTAVNAAAGVRLNRARTTLSIIGTNLTDERIQQHVFGDIIGRKILAQVQFRY